MPKRKRRSPVRVADFAKLIPEEVKRQFDHWRWDPGPFVAVVSSLEDPRRDHLKEYPLAHVLLLALSAMTSGCETWDEIARHGVTRHGWFQSMGIFSEHPPSHDTLSRVFGLLNPRTFERCLSGWLADVIGPVRGVVAIDGKTVRGSVDRNGDVIHAVSAFATDLGVSLAHVPVAEKSNEITAIPQVLDLIAITGCTVTIDAMGCQRDIAERIRRDGGHYLLHVKANQPTTLNAIVDYFTNAEQHGWRGITHTTATTFDSGHGRTEHRHAWACPVSGPWIDALGWKDLTQIVRIRRQRTTKNGTTCTEDHYYLSSDNADANVLLDHARRHWAIENRCHWVLDVAFNEDRCQTRTNNAAKNLLTLRRFVLNLLRLHPAKGSLKLRRKVAGWDLAELISILNLIKKPVSHQG
jgi:predicted transposase YbfD/YdcC